MPAQHTHNEIAYPEYTPPAINALEAEIKLFRFMFERFCQTFGYNPAQFSVDEAQLVSVFIRVDQRKLHYKMYHRGMQINELKEVAVLCYWINLFKPITFNMGGYYTSKGYNERFCLFLIISVIREYRSLQKLPDVIPTNENIFQNFSVFS